MIASIHKSDQAVWNIRFRFGGRNFNRSLQTCSERVAKTRKGTIEETLMLLEQGHKTIPKGLTPDQIGKWIVTTGKLTDKPMLAPARSLASVCDEYHRSLPHGAKEDITISTERTHMANLQRHLKPNTPIQSTGVQELQQYVKKRQSDRGANGNTIQPPTIQKELATFRLVWSYAKSLAYVEGDCPVRHVQLPKSNERPRFKTWEQITREVNRGGLSDEQQKQLWNCLFLRADEVGELLEHVAANAAHPFIHPMFAFAAFTGARRSEIIRSEIADFQFDDHVVLIREKKRRRDRALSFRDVRLHPRLEEVMMAWFHIHPGGPYTICTPANFVRSKKRSDSAQPLTPSQTHDFFKRTLAGSKWSVVRGFHLLRHSFASNLAMKGVHQSVIDRWMGHQTEDMRQRYRHLFPEETDRAIQALSF